MSEPGFWDDQEHAQQLLGRLKPAKAACEAFDRLSSDLDDVELLADVPESEMQESDLRELEGMVAELEERHSDLELRTLLSGPFDAGGAVLTVQAGAGGTDASDWAEMLLRMYARWAERMGYRQKLLEALEHEEAGIKHATLRISGPYAFGYLTAEIGVHRLVRISPFDAAGRRQTSFAAVDVIPDIEDDVPIEINEKDLKIDTYKAGGKGGQHVNKTESAVRITHLPTGTVVQCQNERSQHKNRAQALKILKARLIQLQEAERNKELRSLYDTKGQIAWGNQIRSYVLAPYTLVKDHRTNLENGNVQAVLDGDIQPFIEAYLRMRARQGQKTS